MSASARPYSKFYWSDWRSDPRLRMCSLAARGLWMEMLALMHEAKPYGHLVVSGRAPTDTQLAALAGAPSDQLPDLLAELNAVGVFSQTKEGVIYSRRMVRDEKRARHAQKIGKMGGNPHLTSVGNKTINPAQDNPPDKGPLKTQNPEPRTQNPENQQQQQPGASTEPRAPPDGEPAEPAVLLLRCYDDLEARVFAERRRPWKHPSDLGTARRFAESSVTEAELVGVAEPILQRMAAQGAGPPKSLSYIEAALSDARTGKQLPAKADRYVPLAERQLSPEGEARVKAALEG